MLSERTIKALNGISNATLQNGVRVKHLFRIMTSYQDLWMRAYANIYSNQGALTKGVDNNTLDGMSAERVANIIQQLKDGAYEPSPAKRVYIPKKNGKKRPLGIPTGNDKLVQEMVRILLEQVYEATFSDHSHGFRPNRSCHTALNEIKKTWSGVKWIVDMDITGFYDNIDHEKLIELLEKKIDDVRFINLIKRLLKAGVLENWVFHKTYSGAPQGGICSPILANIFLHELDQFAENKCKDFNIGKLRKVNPAYTKLQTKALKAKDEWFRAKKYGGVLPFFWEAQSEAIKDIDEQRRKIPYYDVNDAGYKRLRYIRYADDFALGVCGSKEDAEQISSTIKDFLSEKLLLKVSEEKSGIRYIKDGFGYLGYHVFSNPKATRLVKAKCGVTKDGRNYYGTIRSLTDAIALEVPKEKVWEFCKEKGYLRNGNEPKARNDLLHLDDLDIVTVINAEMRGFANYYSLAPKERLYIMEWAGVSSLFHTLAKKHKTSCNVMRAKLKLNDDHCVRYVSNGQQKLCRVFKVKHRTEPDISKNPDVKPNEKIFSNRKSEILKRYNAKVCEYCGVKDSLLEIHHVRKLKDLSNKPNKKPWELRMSALRRKTLILCKECHNQLHRGELPGWKRDFYTKTESAVQ